MHQQRFLTHVTEGAIKNVDHDRRKTLSRKDVNKAFKAEIEKYKTFSHLAMKHARKEIDEIDARESEAYQAAQVSYSCVCLFL